jgi:uncharacterized protein (TIGR02996 family)
MPDLMAIISKAVFEKAAGKAPQLGARLGMDRYDSANKNLEALAAGGKLYLVTVRPPDEALWLVAVLDQPRFQRKQWVAAPCDTPITDISALRGRIKFESGKGMSAAPGTLGMSLQTPRALTAADVALLEAALGGAPLGHGAPGPGGSDAGGDRAARLLADILADPDSNAARQVYADELVTRNDPRGELILVDLALAGPLSIRKREALSKHRAELIKRHAEAWWPYPVAFRVNRGFIEAIAGSRTQLERGAAVFAAEPVVEVTVDDPGGKSGVAKLARADWMRRVRRLVMRELDDEGFIALVAGDGCQGVQALNVCANELSAEAVEALGDHLPACRSLVLTANPIGDEGITALRDWQHLRNVEALYLSQCELSTQGVAELVSSPLPALVKLALTNNELDDEVAGVLAAHAANLPALRFLELKATGLSPAVLEIFQHSKLALARLDLRRTAIRPEQAASLPFVRAGE